MPNYAMPNTAGAPPAVAAGRILAEGG